MLPGGSEWIIILIIVLVLFGVGRVSRIGGELGSAISNFRKGLRDGQQDVNKPKDDGPIKS